jgi:hypothetical protein
LEASLSNGGESLAFTQDADLRVVAPFGLEAPIVDGLLRRFQVRTPAARRRAFDHRVLLLTASNGVSLDISLAALPFEEEVLERASVATDRQHLAGNMLRRRSRRVQSLSPAVPRIWLMSPASSCGRAAVWMWPGFDTGALSSQS